MAEPPLDPLVADADHPVVELPREPDAPAVPRQRPKGSARPARVIADHGCLIDRVAFAARLGVGVSTFDRYRASGKIGPPAVKVVGAVGFRLAEVLEWLATPLPGGGLHDASSWPAVWATRRKTGGREQ